MFQLVARVNDVLNLTYSASEHKWVNTDICPLTLHDVGLSKENDVVEGMEILNEVFGPIPAKIDIKFLCLN